MKKRRDIIAQSQSGTGKTAAFVISALLSIDESKKKTQILILSPTRELTIQTHKVCKELSTFTAISTALIIGGQSLEESLEQLSFSPQMVIGSTGRVLDMLKRKKIDATYIHLLILDEVGVQFGSEFEKQLLFDVLNERYEKLKPSILLSNIPREQLADYLGIFDNKIDGFSFS